MGYDMYIHYENDFGVSQIDGISFVIVTLFAHPFLSSADYYEFFSQDVNVQYVMTSIIMLHKRWHTLEIFMPKILFLSNYMSCDK